MNRDRWHCLMAAFALPETNDCFDQLLDAYSQKHRHYHTVAHIDHCLREFDAASELARPLRSPSSPQSQSGCRRPEG